MSDQKVEYELSLKDGLSPSIDNADKHVNKLEHSMHSVKESGMEMLGALGVGFAIFKGIDFVETAVHSMHELEQSIAQVKAGLESTQFAAGMTFEEIEASAKSLAKNLPYSRSAIMDMQAQLLTFPAVTKTVFDQASRAVLDMASRTHRGANELAIMVGKALQDPLHGIMAMRRVGVNFNETQTEIIKKLVETGHVAEAQMKILQELSLEFGGSARAAAEADPLFRYNKLMGSIKMEVGEAAIELLQSLTPALELVANAFKTVFLFGKDVIEFLKEHKSQLLGLVEIIGIALVAYKAFQAWQVLSYMWMMRDSIATALTISLKGTWATVTGYLTVAQTALNAAIAANPIGFILTAIVAVIAAIVVCYKHFGTFRATLLGIWETIKEFGRIVADIFTGVGKVILGVLTFSPKMVVEGAKQTIDAIADAGTRMGGAFKKGFDEGMADFNKDHEKEKDGLVPKKTLIAKSLGQGAAIKEPKSKATGSKSITINVSIKDLIGTQNINTTTLKEGLPKIKEMVVQVLSGAVNDFQIVADH